MTPSAESFEAVVRLEGVNPYVDVPEAASSPLLRHHGPEVLLRLAASGQSAQEADARDGERVARNQDTLVRVGRLTPDGWFRTTMVPRRGGAHRLFLDGWMRDTAGVGVGDRVAVVLRSDDGPRALPVPRTLQQRLEEDADVRRAWADLPVSRRKEILAYLNFLKTPEALERNVGKIVRTLRGRGDG